MHNYCYKIHVYTYLFKHVVKCVISKSIEYIFKNKRFLFFKLGFNDLDSFLIYKIMQLINLNECELMWQLFV